MPTYEYICKECNAEFEMSGTFEMLLVHKPECPECKSKKVKKKISLPNIIYKGKGFYNTDRNDE